MKKEIDHALHNEFKEHYKKNLERYTISNPGEYVLIEKGFVESFYKNVYRLKKAVKQKYGETIEYDAFSMKIPKKKN